MTAKFLFLNGPPRSGKDTLAKHLEENFDGCKVVLVSFAHTLKMFCHSSLGMAKQANAFEGVKDKPLPEFYGRTPRESYIAFAENYMRPTYGQTIFGVLAKQRVDNILKVHPSNQDILFVITDCGFIDEIEVFAEAYGGENITILHLHRRGCDFSIDSRAYVVPAADSGVKLEQLTNIDGNVEYAKDWINRFALDLIEA